jgi:AraC-like DNA-binding protein
MNAKNLQLFDKNNLLDKPNDDENRKDLFEVFKCGRGDKFTHRPNNIALAFLTKGEIELSINDCSTKTVRKNEFFIIPNTVFNVFAVKDSSLLCVYLKTFLNSEEFCSHIRNIIFTDLSQTDSREPVVLTMNDLLKETVSFFLKQSENCAFCNYYYTLILRQIIVMIFIFYQKDKVTRLFAFANKGNSLNNDFESKVLKYRNKVFTVNELASLQNMGIYTFRNNFIRNFGIPPKQWIINERKKLIYRELTEGNKTIREIADLAGFPSEISLYKFVRKYFNKTVNNIKFGEINVKKHIAE